MSRSKKTLSTKTTNSNKSVKKSEKEKPAVKAVKTAKKQPVTNEIRAIKAKKSPNKELKLQVLNVGGGSKETPIPDIYNNWEHVLLDIDPKGKPDIVCDARELKTLGKSKYDAIYCSHNLEHYHHHDAMKILQGFVHLIKDEGFVHIRVPDMKQLMQIVVEKNLDIDDFLYESALGPILVRDVIYGYGVEIEKSKKDYYSHKTGFTPASLQKALIANGFTHVFIGTTDLEIIAIAFKTEPSAFAKKLLFNQ